MMPALRLRLPTLVVAVLLVATAPGCATDDAAKKDAEKARKDADKAAGTTDEKAKQKAEDAAKDVDGN